MVALGLARGADRGAQTAEKVEIAVDVMAIEAVPGLVQGILDLEPEPWPPEGSLFRSAIWETW